MIFLEFGLAGKVVTELEYGNQVATLWMVEVMYKVGDFVDKFWYSLRRNYIRFSK